MNTHLGTLAETLPALNEVGLLPRVESPDQVPELLREMKTSILPGFIIRGEAGMEAIEQHQKVAQVIDVQFPGATIQRGQWTIKSEGGSRGDRHRDQSNPAYRLHTTLSNGGFVVLETSDDEHNVKLREHVEPGDSVFFRIDQPHRFDTDTANVDRETCTTTWYPNT